MVTAHFGSSIELNIDLLTPEEFFIHWRGMEGVRLDVFQKQPVDSSHRQITVEVSC